MFTKFNQRSISFKYMAFYMIGLFTFTIIFSTGFLWRSHTSLDEQLNRIIRADSDSLSEFYDLQGSDGLTELLSYRLRTNPNTESVYLLTDAQFNPILGNIREWPENIDKSTIWGEVDWKYEVEWLELRYFHRTLSDGTHLLVGHYNSQIELFRNTTAFFLILIVLLSLIIGAILGLFFRRQLQMRIDDIIDGCDQISEGNLDHRIRTVDKGDELNEMAKTLNFMLDRVQSLMDGIKYVSDSIAHDLRTPLTRLYNKLEDVEHKLEGKEAHADITEALADVGEILSTFQSLLYITRLEKKQISQDIEEIDLDMICQDLFELYEPIADDKNQNLEFKSSGEVKINGYRNLIFQALSNILDNAIKYSPEGAIIKFTLRKTSSGYDVIIQDQGAGIPEHEMDKVFDRFYRLDKSRHEKGNGLGLTMVGAIMELSEGKIQLANDHGLVVTLSFPYRK